MKQEKEYGKQFYVCTLGPNIGNPSKDHNNMNVFAKMIKLCKSVVGGSSTFTAFSRTVLKYTPVQKQFSVVCLQL